MRLEEIVDDLRGRRRRIVELRSRDQTDRDVVDLLVDEAMYDSRLVQLATMLDVPLPLSRRREGGLYADDRYLLEDRLAEAGVDLRAADS